MMGNGVVGCRAAIEGSEDGSVVMDQRTTTGMLWSTVVSMASIGGQWGDGVVGFTKP
jgi:hypothetical protein